MPDKPDHFVLICATCTGMQPLGVMRSALAAALPDGFAIRNVDCMAGCAHPTTVGFQAIGKAHYLFGDIQTPSDIEALIAFASQYQNSADGWTKASERPVALYRKTLSRMPGISPEASI